MSTTKIEWTDASWNPIRGCSRVSPGCDHCYAMHMAHRFSGPGQPYEGLTRYTKHQGVDWIGKVRFVPEKLDEPLRWRKPRRVFVCSMSDLFHEKVTNEQIAAVFGVMAACPQHTFQVLTKRPRRMAEWFAWYEGISGAGACPHAALSAAASVLQNPHLPYGCASDDDAWPIPNVMLGVSVEDQKRADERIPLLLEVPAVMRFVSYEPTLGQLDLEAAFSVYDCNGKPSGPRCNPDGSSALSWIIAGCESGQGARPADVEWFRSLRDQCQEAGVPFFLKQMRVDGKLVKMPALDGKVWDEVPR